MDALAHADAQPVQDRMRLLMSEVHELSGVEDGDLSAVLQRTVDLARAVTGARYCALGVLAETVRHRAGWYQLWYHHLHGHDPATR